MTDKGRPRCIIPAHLVLADRSAGLSIYAMARLRRISERTLARFFVAWDFCRYGFDPSPGSDDQRRGAA